jgi:hypothetical protein
MAVCDAETGEVCDAQENVQCQNDSDQLHGAATWWRHANTISGRSLRRWFVQKIEYFLLYFSRPDEILDCALFGPTLLVSLAVTHV